jgi:hypothetical protein
MRKNKKTAFSGGLINVFYLIYKRTEKTASLGLVNQK